MKNMQDDEHSSVKDYSEFFIDVETLENKIHTLGGVEAIDFYEYVIQKLEENPENSDLLWLAAMKLENIPAVILYKGNPGVNEDLHQQSVDTVNSHVNELATSGNGNSTLTKEDEEVISSIVSTLEAKRKVNPIKKLLKIIRA